MAVVRAGPSGPVLARAQDLARRHVPPARRTLIRQDPRPAAIEEEPRT
ncbi:MULTISPECIES: hypothetical protein [Streptomyces]|nr:hypothetical protein OG806_42305 [Streptomyces sp. NBC_00882]WSZ62515.1 hypothetical protein OH824_41225 [Streptomyces canus]